MFHVAVFTHFYCYERFQWMTILPTIIANLKQMDCQIFLWQKWIYSGSAENCNLGSATMMSHVQVSTWQGKETVFTERKRKLEGYSKLRAWLFTGWVLARKEVLVGLRCLCRVWELPLLVSQLYLIEVCVYYRFLLCCAGLSRSVYFVGGLLDCFL